MKKIITLALVLVCNFTFFIPKSSAFSAKDLSAVCGADGFTQMRAEETGRLDEFYENINKLLLYTDATDKKYSAKEIKKLLDKGWEEADDERLFVSVALGAGIDITNIERVCYMLDRQNDLDDYAKNIVLGPYDADLTYSKKALVEEKFDPVNIGFWHSNTSVIFPLYIDETGEYEISVNYSKRDKNGSREPLELYILGEIPKNFSDDMLLNSNNFTFYSDFYIPLPTTGTWSNYVNEILTYIDLKKDNTYYLVLRDTNSTPNKFTMNLRNIFVKKMD